MSGGTCGTSKRRALRHTVAQDTARRLNGFLVGDRVKHVRHGTRAFTTAGTVEDFDKRGNPCVRWDDSPGFAMAHEPRFLVLDVGDA